MNSYVQNPLTTSYSAQQVLASQGNIGTPSIQDNNQEERSGRNFEAIISDELLSQEFQGELTNVITQLSSLQSSLVNDDIVSNTNSLLELFDRELPDISSIQAFQHIQDPNEQVKAQLNHGLIDLKNRIDTLSADEKRNALTQLRHLEVRVQNQSMQFQLDQYSTGNGTGQDPLSLLGSGTLSESQMQFILEKQINEMVYQPLIDIGNSSDDDDDNDDNSNKNQGFGSLAQPAQLNTNSPVSTLNALQQT